MPRRENLPEKERFNCLLKRFNSNTASGLLNLPDHAGAHLFGEPPADRSRSDLPGQEKGLE